MLVWLIRILNSLSYFLWLIFLLFHLEATLMFIYMKMFAIILMSWHHFLGGEMLAVAEPFLQQQMHPTVIISAFRQALEDLVEILRDKIRYKYGTVSPCMFVFSISFLFLFFKFHFVNSNIMNTFSLSKKPYRDVM